MSSKKIKIKLTKPTDREQVIKAGLANLRHGLRGVDITSEHKDKTGDKTMKPEKETKEIKIELNALEAAEALKALGDRVAETMDEMKKKFEVDMKRIVSDFASKGADCLYVNKDADGSDLNDSNPCVHVKLDPPITVRDGKVLLYDQHPITGEISNIRVEDK